MLTIAFCSFWNVYRVWLAVHWKLGCFRHVIPCLWNEIFFIFHHRISIFRNVMKARCFIQPNKGTQICFTIQLQFRLMLSARVYVKMLCRNQFQTNVPDKKHLLIRICCIIFRFSNAMQLKDIRYVSHHTTTTIPRRRIYG